MFVRAFRQLWSDTIAAKGLIIIYFDLPGNSRDFLDAEAKLSNVIDEVRGVYSNIGEGKYPIGQRSFESLMDMLCYFKTISPGSAARLRMITKKNITDSWKAFQDVFLEEFDRPTPSCYILRRGIKRSNSKVQCQ